MIFNVKVAKKYLDRKVYCKIPSFQEKREYSAFNVSSRYKKVSSLHDIQTNVNLVCRHSRSFIQSEASVQVT